jgi:hypothetical protein
VDILDKIIKVGWFVVLALDYFAVRAKDGVTVVIQFGEVTLVYSIKCLIQIPSHVGCILVADIDKIS